MNSIVVNAVNFRGQSASYTRIGPVPSFLKKPDLSYKERTVKKRGEPLPFGVVITLKEMYGRNVVQIL